MELSVWHEGVLLVVLCGEPRPRASFKAGIGAPRALQIAIKLGDECSAEAASKKLVAHHKWPRLYEWLLQQEHGVRARLVFEHCTSRTCAPKRCA